MKVTPHFTAFFIFGFCFLFRDPLEADPVRHILVQLPLLAWSGVLITNKNIIDRQTEWNKGGVAALLIAFFTIAFWMLPRSIDAALSSPIIEFVKFVTLPLGVGVPIAIGWKSAHPLLRGFIKAQTISMLGVMAFVYTHASVRICNAYLVSDQTHLGYGFLFLALVLTIFWIVPLFSANKTDTELPPIP